MMKPSPWVKEAVYGAAPSSTGNAPVSTEAGVDLADGSRIFAECYNVTGPTRLKVTLLVSQNGARAYLDGDGTNITGGSVRWWVFNPLSRAWHLGGVDEALATGASRVASTDQFITVGAA